MENILQTERVRFQQYADLLADWNTRIDLTSIPAEETWTRHFADSLQVMNFADFSEKSAIDIGSGAGFPGIPLKIAVPSLSLTLLDATAKRIDFMRTVCEELNLDANIIHGRAEEKAKPGDSAKLRESFDFALSRAVAKLTVLSELTLPFVKVGGAAILHKGERAEEELTAAADTIKALGAEVECVQRYEYGNIIVLRKGSATPEKYPRSWRKINA